MTDELFNHINEVIGWAEEIQGQWDGDNAGSLEDRAHLAEDIALHAKEMKILIAQMENL